VASTPAASACVGQPINAEARSRAGPVGVDASALPGVIARCRCAQEASSGSDESVVEDLEVPARLPHLRRHDHGRVETHDVVAELHGRTPPRIADVALELDPERAVVPRRAEPAVISDDGKAIPRRFAREVMSSIRSGMTRTPFPAVGSGRWRGAHRSQRRTRFGARHATFTSKRLHGSDEVATLSREPNGIAGGPSFWTERERRQHRRPDPTTSPQEKGRISCPRACPHPWREHLHRTGSPRQDPSPRGVLRLLFIRTRNP
jgi:hypothetical protein